MVMTSELNQDQSYQTDAVSKGNSDSLKLSFAPVESTDVIKTSFAVSLFLHLTSYENQITRLVPNDFDGRSHEIFSLASTSKYSKICKKISSDPAS